MDLNIDQVRVINSKTTGHSLIKGVAGSGKTTVALFKIIAMQQEKDNRDVLVVTYNRTLISYMEYLCKMYGVSLDNHHVEVKTIDSVIYGLYELLPDKKKEIVKEGKQRQLLGKAIQKIRENYPECELIDAKNMVFLAQEIDWMKSCRYITLEEYMNVDRLGRNSQNSYNVRLAKNSLNRQAIFELYVLYEHYLEQENLTDYKTKAIHVLQGINEKKITLKKKYSYIIVDESQDLTRVQLEIIRELYKESADSSIIFIADVAQSIYSQSWLSKRSFKSVGFDMSGKSNILSKNYRTTKQIAQAAYSLLSKDNELKDNFEYVEPELLERNGRKPLYRNFASQEEEMLYIAEEIKKCALSYDLQDIIVIARNNSYLNSIKEYLLKHGIDAELNKVFEQKHKNSFFLNKIKLYTLHAIKGLEAAVVFIAGLNHDIMPYCADNLDEERKLLYVGMTRARESLYMTSAGRKSVYIEEIDAKYLQLSDEEKENFYGLSIENYRFKSRIKDINSEEEKVRQWFLEQLQLKYGYTLNQITIEDVVKFGSKNLYVDVVVYEDERKEQPYIYAEIKKPGEDLQLAMKQLKSYMVPGNTARYLLVTDGVDQICEKYDNWHFEKSEDIFLSDANAKKQDVDAETKKQNVDFKNVEDGSNKTEDNGEESFCYIDFLHGRKIYYKKHTDEEELKTIVGDTNLLSVELPVCGTVAAGHLKYVQKEYEEKQRVPSVVVQSANGRFILKVSGDSMIDFGIYDGDYIVVKKQVFANEGNIVIAGDMAEGTATVKQIFYEGYENVVLHPGNKKYQDIHVGRDTFYMNGVVIGVIHCKNM